MNNKITIDETVSLRTRRLLRFSYGFDVLFGSFFLLILSGWVMIYKGASILSLSLLTVSLFACALGAVASRFIINKRKRESIYAKSAQPRFNLKIFIIRCVIIFILLLSVYLLYNYLDVAGRSISTPVKLVWYLTLLFALFDLFAFYKARLLEDIIFPVVIFGVFLIFIAVSALPNNMMTFALSLLVLAAFVQMVHGIILCVRWRRATRQVSSESREVSGT